MSSWPTVRLGEVLKQYDRSVPTSTLTEVNLAGVYSFGRGLFKRGPMNPGETSYRTYNRLVADDFVISQPKAWEGALARVTEEYAGWYLSPVFPCFRPDTDRLDPRYFEWFCKREPVWNELKQLAQGLGARRESVAPDKFLSLTVPLPPRSEQRRIVGRIEELSGEIAAAQRLQGEVQKEAEALTYASLRQIRLRLLTSTHPISQLGTITRVTAGGTPSRDNAAFWDGDIPWVKTGELMDRDITATEEHITQDAVENSSAKLFPPDTILIALYGQGQTRGRTGRLLIAATTNQACCAVLPRPEILDARFIQFWLRSLYLELREQAQGGAQPNWNSGMIKELEIALPTLAEQHRIVTELDSLQADIDALKAAQAETASGLDAFMPAVLDRAFKGEL